MRVVLSLVCAALCFLACGCAGHSVRSANLAQPPLVVSDSVRARLCPTIIFASVFSRRREGDKPFPPRSLARLRHPDPAL